MGLYTDKSEMQKYYLDFLESKTTNISHIKPSPQIA